MENRNNEPLLIVTATGIFLLLVTVIFPGIFQGQRRAAASAVIQAAATGETPSEPEKNADTLQAAMGDNGQADDLYNGLEAFYGALREMQADHTTLHIAYFGDSMIEGDLVTQTVRRLMQKRFGGNGIGFVPITSPMPGFRNTIRQSFNDDWTVFTFVRPDKKDGLQPGISGYVFLSGPGAETRFEVAPGYSAFHRADILYGGTNEVTLKILTDTASRQTTLSPSKELPVSVYRIPCDTLFSSLELRVASAAPAVFYGVNFENGPGVYVDNYAFRGNSGLPLSRIPSGLFAGFNKQLGNKLIIIHYGLNVFTPGINDYHWYESAMVQVVRHVKESSPGCAILMVSMPDRSSLISGEYFTPAELPGFIRLQQRIAREEHVAFFNLYAAMGGANSMKQWVEGQPKLAGDDYTHPNGAGASRIASMVFDFLVKGFDHPRPQPDSLTTQNTSNPL